MRWTPLAAALGGILASTGCDVTPLSNGAPKDLSCSSCHGSADNPAPPKGVNGETDTATLAVGAHQRHLTDSSIRAAIACSDCHPVPATIDAPGHVDGKVDFAFSALATTGGLSPAFDPATATCSATWCHGTLLRGGRIAKPVWNNVGGGQASCGACHGLPPPAPHPAETDCHKCHSGTVNADGTINIAGGLHIDGKIEGTPYHPAGWQAGNQHGPQAEQALGACMTCHGADLNGGGTGVSCNQCHNGWRTNCTFCHGGKDNQTGAPPVDTHQKTATTEVTIGAHSAHLSDSAIRKAIDCSECHTVPTDATSPGHIDAATATLTFGTLATTGGAVPGWDRPSATCGSTYCHGATLQGGTNTRPQWTKVDATQAACGTCHGLPPPAPHPAGTNCNLCHPGTVNTDGTINVAGGLHIDGKAEAGQGHPPGWIADHGAQANLGIVACEACHGADLTGGGTGVSCDQCHSGFKTNCTFCHGGKDNQTGAPPVDTHQKTATTEVTIGAHSAHLSDSVIRKAIACSDCHTVPTSALSPGHIDAPTATLTFSPLARTMGANPAFTRTDGKCASVYCHGATIGGGTNVTPVWTKVDGTQAACGTCHSLPPPAPHPAQTDCHTCHPQTVKADGTIDVNGGFHIDGIVQAQGYHPANWSDGTQHGPAALANLTSCEACHGSDLNGGVVGRSCNLCHNGWKTNCTFCHGGTDNPSGAPPRDTHGATLTSAVTVGAHSSHLMAKGHLSNPVACSECHVVPADALSVGHIDAATATLTFGTLATTRSSTPSWNRTTAQCSSTYCHGAKLGGGTNKTPTWTTVDGSQEACGTCHGLPPTGSWPGFPEGTFSHQYGQHSSYACGRCHPDAATTGKSISNPAQHIDGTVQINSTASGCTCH